MKKIDVTLEDQIVKEYKHGYGTKYLASHFHIHRTTIQRILKRRKVGLRKRSSLYHYDPTFFDEYNELSCYWAGFIWADGHIRKDRHILHIKLAEQDSEHLASFLKHIRSERLVHKYQHAHRDTFYVVVDICGDWFLNSLSVKFGLSRDKKVRSHPLTLIPPQYHSHFLRGLFDGDGCVTTPKGHVCLMNFAGDKNLIEPLSQYFGDQLDVHLKSRNRYAPFIWNPWQTAGHINYSGKNAIKILSWLYEGATFCMGRKHMRFQKIMEMQTKSVV